MPEPRLHVVAAALRRATGEVLLSYRAARQAQGDCWEFPGGKVHQGEAPLVALARELKEELDIEIAQESVSPLIDIPHDYPERAVRLQVWEVTHWRGEPRGMEQQPIEWVAPAALRTRRFPAANLPIITALQLPRTLLITPDPIANQAFVEELERCLQDGERLVQLRANDATTHALKPLARAAQALCHRYGARLMINGSIELMHEFGASGLHLKSVQLASCHARPIGADRLLSVACHSPDELARAYAIGADFALLSPIAATASHPTAVPLGWDAAAAWVRDAKLPVYALGGQSRETLADAIAHGCQGIAAISGLWPATSYIAGGPA